MKKKTQNKTENKLIELVKQGDKDVFTFLYHQHSEMLFLLALRYLKDASLSQDAVQHTFSHLWENHTNIFIKSSLQNYLYTMTKNYVLNQIRHNNVVIAHHYEMAQTQPRTIEDIIVKIEKEEKVERLYKALEKLPERSRKICLMKMEGSMTNEEIASKMQLSTSSVKLIYRRTKEVLKEYLEKY